jgi:hypothetical protein
MLKMFLQLEKASFQRKRHGTQINTRIRAKMLAENTAKKMG